MKPFTKILVPTDFSPCADRALERAIDLRQRFGATLTLLHVYELPVLYPDGVAFTADTLAAIERNARTAMDRHVALAESMARQAAGGEPVPPIATRLATGAPALTILDEVRAGGHDLIVMGTQGRTGLARFLIGSVAERVVRTAPCPVLTVREAEDT